jgi:hypothetical protein
MDGVAAPQSITETLINTGRKYWLIVGLEVFWAGMLAFKQLTVLEYTALALPAFFAYLGVNFAQKLIPTKPEVNP